MKVGLLGIIMVLMFFPIVYAETIHPMSTAVVIMNAEEFPLEDVKVVVHSTVYSELCSICERDPACCGYCGVPLCSGDVRESSELGGFAESVANLKFSQDYSIENGSKICPSVEIAAGESCVQAGAVDINKDKVWFTIDKYGYISNKQIWNEVYDEENFRFSLDELFGLTEEDHELVKKNFEKGQKEFAIKDEDIRDIITDDNKVNATIDEDEKGIVLLTEAAKRKYKMGMLSAGVGIIYLWIILFILIITIILVSMRKKKKEDKINKKENRKKEDKGKKK